MATRTQKYRYSECALLLAFLLVAFLTHSRVVPQQADQVVTLVYSFKVRVRATPQIKPDNIVASLLKGTQLPMIGEKDGWYQVKLSDGETGWVHGDYGKLESPRDQLEVIVEVARIRAGPTVASENTARAIAGQRLHLLEKVDNWYKVEIPEELEGWVREDMVAFRPAVAEQSSLTEQPESELNENSLEVPKAEDSLAESDAAEPEPEISSLAMNIPQVPEVASNDRTEEPGSVTTRVDIDWVTVLVIAALLSAFVILVLGLLRRRRLKSIHQTIQKGRSKTNDLERTLVREVREAQVRLGDLEKRIKNRFADFQAATPGSEAMAAKTSEDLLNHIEELRLVIQDQQKRMDLYSELVSLQNEQIEALKQESASFKKLLDLKEQE
jgi:uncharacterized protein YgiM (DUF1202 family)